MNPAINLLFPLRTYQINPETKDTLENSGEENQYSTLVHDNKMNPLPPKNTFPSLEMELSRINSRSLLLEGSYNGRSASQSFQVLSRESSAGMPQDYQVAVSSTENLCGFGDTPEGIRRNSSGLVFQSSRGSTSSQLTEVSFVDEAVSGPYERIQIVNSSPRVPSFGGKRGATLPANMSSPGSLMMRGTPPAELRRHTSAVDDTDDYARLDQTTVGRVPQPLAYRRGSRGVSVSSTQSQQFPLLNKQCHSLTREAESLSLPFTRESESPPIPSRISLPFTRESESPPIPVRNFALTNKAVPSYGEDPPPSYSDVISPLSSSGSPISPSGVSLISNGAYEGVVPAENELVADSETLNMEGSQVLPNEHPWCRNASDSSLDPQQPGKSSRIMPYSQVSNFEIDSRMMVETGVGGSQSAARLPRFSLTGQGGALPYTEAVDSSADGLSSVPTAQA